METPKQYAQRILQECKYKGNARVYISNMLIIAYLGHLKEDKDFYIAALKELDYL